MAPARAAPSSMRSSTTRPCARKARIHSPCDHTKSIVPPPESTSSGPPRLLEPAGLAVAGRRPRSGRGAAADAEHESPAVAQEAGALGDVRSPGRRTTSRRDRRTRGRTTRRGTGLGCAARAHQRHRGRSRQPASDAGVSRAGRCDTSSPTTRAARRERDANWAAPQPYSSTSSPATVEAEDAELGLRDAPRPPGFRGRSSRVPCVAW